jgi:hypothetical protein
MVPLIQVSDFADAGVTLTSPLDATFDAAVRSLFKGNADELLKMKPFLAIVSNRADKTIVAYTVRWELTLSRGTHVIHSQFKYPDAVADTVPRRGNEIRSGEQRIVPMSVELNCGRFDRKATDEYYLRVFVCWLKEYKDTVELRIGLDA